MNCVESVCLGGAILAAVAVGLYPTIADAVQHMVREEKVLEPADDLVQIYRPIKKQYGQLNAMLHVLRTSDSKPPV
jgi:ribulose kinase